MCKLLAILDIQNVDKALAFMKSAGNPMSRHDQDGLGVMRLGPSGLAYQKWFYREQYPMRTNTRVPELSKYQNALDFGYFEDGAVYQKPYALAMHSRAATTAKTLDNVHPFVIGDTGLMHNGVISNHEEWPKKVSTCDSEAILKAYLAADTYKHQSKLNDALSDLEGWYACIVFSGKGYVDIFRDDRTPLFCASVKGVGTVFCTTDSIIKEVCRKLKFRIRSIAPVSPMTAIRWYRDGNIQTMKLDLPEPVWDYKAYLSAREPKEFPSMQMTSEVAARIPDTDISPVTSTQLNPDVPPMGVKS